MTPAPRYIPNEITNLREDIEGLEIILGTLETLNNDYSSMPTVESSVNSMLASAKRKLKDLEERTVMTSRIPLVME